MFEPRIISFDPETFPQVLKKLYLEGWVMIQIHSDRVYFHREIKRTKAEKKVIQTKEYLEFREKYPSKTGIYDDKFITKYNKLVSEGLHKEIMEKVEAYKVEIKVTGKKEANASTWINQKRWMEKFKVVKSDEDSWMNELFDGLSAEIIKLTKQKIEERRIAKMKINKDVVLNIIELYSGKDYN